MMQDSSQISIGDLVIYKNNQLIAFNKPATLPVQSDKTGDKALLDFAEIYCKASVHLVHRIDRPASGVVLFAKNKKGLAHLNQQFQERKIEKTYLAVVKNKPSKEKDTLIHYLKKNGKTNQSRAVDEKIGGSKKAELTYEIIGSIDNYHLLKIDLKSGRHHQIRAQLAAINCPIKGDIKYGFRRGNRDRSIHLHAWKLGFKHPVSAEKVVLEVAPPDEVIWNAFKEQGIF